MAIISEKPENCSPINAIPKPSVMSSKAEAFLSRPKTTNLLAKPYVKLLMINSMVLYKNGVGNTKSCSQSSLELLTIKADVQPAKPITKLIIPNHSIIFFCPSTFTFYCPFCKIHPILFYCKNLSTTYTICNKLIYITLANISALASFCPPLSYSLSA